jgi:hypothetical protein
MAGLDPAIQVRWQRAMNLDHRVSLLRSGPAMTEWRTR